MAMVKANDAYIEVELGFVNYYFALGHGKHSIRYAVVAVLIWEVGPVALQALLRVAFIAMRIIQIAAVAGLFSRVEVIVSLALSALEGVFLGTCLAHWVEDRADFGVAGGGEVGAEPPRHTLASFTIFAVPIPASIIIAGTDWNIASSALPAIFALTKVRPDCRPMEAGGIAHSILARRAFPPVEALAFIRPNAVSILTVGAIS
mmetsp:Transcript_14754/g.22877  ORF Transcript_14754/g.22877 Transcript_14754/m.22877 type:complete len:204 (-) Transcript_14754:840-1451(-)